jgi:hypothetical protein
MCKFKRLVCLFILSILNAITLRIAISSDTDFDLRKLLLSDSTSEFKSSGMITIFSKGSICIPGLVAALNDPNVMVSCNADFMLRLLGDEQGILELHNWYKKQEPIPLVFDPLFPVPLQDWDYQYIRKVLAPPIKNWIWTGLDCFLALAIDGSSQAGELLKEMKKLMMPRQN